MKELAEKGKLDCNECRKEGRKEGRKEERKEERIEKKFLFLSFLGGEEIRS